jgi:hypothetical protein
MIAIRCWSVERRLTAYLENNVSDSEKRQVRSHLGRCAACAYQAETQAQMKLMVRSLPYKPAPADLRVRLQVLASKERLVDHRLGSRLRRWHANLRATAESLMKQIALPAAGGLGAAILLFMMLMPTFAQNQTANVDVPISLFTEPALKSVKPIGFHYGDAEVDLRIDSDGRLVNYSIVSGSCREKDLLRHSIENNLLFTTFTPATAFGKPVSATLRLSFRSSSIDVKG